MLEKIKKQITNLPKGTALLAIVFLVAVFFVLVTPVLAQTDSFGLQEAGDIGLGDTPLKDLIVRIIRIFFGFLGLAAVVLILYGGYMWMTAGGNQDKIDTAKKILRNTVIGLLIVLASYSITEFIISRIGGATGIDNIGGNSSDQSYSYSGGLGGGSIRSHYPGRGATGIPRNVSIVVTFKEETNRQSIMNSSGDMVSDNIIIVDQDDNQVTDVQVATNDNTTFVFTPDDYLGSESSNTRYKITLTSDIQKANGDGMFGPLGSYQWQFTVSTELDITPPTIVSVVPISNSTVPRNAIIQINFSEPINPISASGLSASLFSIITSASGGATVGGEYVIANEYKTVEFVTDDACGTNSCGSTVYCLPGSQPIQVLVKAASLQQPDRPMAIVPPNGIVDMAFNSFDGNGDTVASGPNDDNYNWQFNTTGEIDLSAPVVSNVTPGVSSTNVTTKAKIKATFNKPMMLSTLNAANIQLDQNSNYWITSDNKSGYTESYINHDELGEYLAYHPLISNQVMDLYQNCFNPASGPQDFKIGGANPDYGWAQGVISGDLTTVGSTLRLTQAETEGDWTSPAIDLGETTNVPSIYGLGTIPQGSSLKLYARAATSQSALNSAIYVLVDFDGFVNFDNTRWLQVKAVIKSVVAGVILELNNISINTAN